MASKPIISVVIPAYNEATYIDRLLEALSKQSFDSFEVIVSDAQSNDGTKEVVQSFKDKLDIHFYEAPPKGPAFGRNEGARHASGEWLLFLDADDDIMDPDFLSVLLRETKARNWQTSTAKYNIIDPTLGERMGMGFINYQYLKLLSHTKKPVSPGYCIFTNRSIFESVGGFNEKIQFGEDYDYVTRVGSQGFGFIESTSYLIDMRRSREEGLSLFIKGIKNEFYRHTHGNNLEANKYEYRFGKHKPRGH